MKFIYSGIILAAIVLFNSISTPQLAHTQVTLDEGCIEVFVDVNYTGQSKVFCTGVYNSVELTTFYKQISSIKVADNTTVQIFSFRDNTIDNSGKAWKEINYSIPDLSLESTNNLNGCVNNNFDNCIQSITVAKSIGNGGNLNARVLSIIVDPVMPDGRKLHQFSSFYDPNSLMSQINVWFKAISNNDVNFIISEHIEYNNFTQMMNGEKYTPERYIDCWINKVNCIHSSVDYNWLADTFDICEKLNSQEIDAVWIYEHPLGGYYESTLLGPNPYFYNSEGTVNNNCNKNVPIFGFNYHGDISYAIHDFFHSTESSMKFLYGSWTQDEMNHNWDKFSLTDFAGPNYNFSGCGNGHFPPNGTSDYDYANANTVLSYCDAFLNYDTLPADLSSVLQPINCTAWHCTHIGFAEYWFKHIPNKSGMNTDGFLNNWWHYIVDPNSVFEADRLHAEFQISTATPVMANQTIVSFIDKSSGSLNSPSAWEWDFNDDGIIDSNLQNPTYIYTQPGQYNVTLTVHSSTKSDTVRIRNVIIVYDINDIVPHFTVSSGQVEGINSKVQFHDRSTTQGSTINSWQWDFDSNGTIDSTEQNPIHSYGRSGIFSVTLIVSNGIKSAQITQNNLVNVINNNSVVYVSTTGSDLNTGEKHSPFRHINHAVNSSNYVKEIRVEDGIYHENVILTNDFKKLIGNRHSPEKVVLIGNESSNTLTLYNQTYVEGFTIKNLADKNTSIAAIKTFGSANLTNNIIKDSPIGIYITSLYPIIKNNTIVNNNKGMFLEGENARGYYANNIFAFNNIGLFCSDMYHIMYGGYNNFFGHVDQDVACSSSSNIDNLFLDPQIVDNTDFRLAHGSPLIDKGYLGDIASSEPLPNGNRINIGAYGNTINATRSSIPKVRVYVGKSYTGKFADFTVGKYTQSDLAAKFATLPQNISSLKPTKGTQVRLFSGDNFTGSEITIYTAHKDLGVFKTSDSLCTKKPGTWNDCVKSMIIEERNEASSLVNSTNLSKTRFSGNLDYLIDFNMFKNGSTPEQVAGYIIMSGTSAKPYIDIELDDIHYVDVLEFQANQNAQYDVFISSKGVNWTKVKTFTNSSSLYKYKTFVAKLHKDAKFVRIQGTATTNKSYVISEVRMFGFEK